MKRPQTKFHAATMSNSNY